MFEYNAHLLMYGQGILGGISKGIFEFHTKYLTHTLKDMILLQC